jgi:PAS domain-containing protein
MNKKPIYEEVEQAYRKLEEETKRRLKAEKALQKSEEMYRDLFENSPNAYFFISSEDGSILRCNTASMTLLGYDRAARLTEYQRPKMFSNVLKKGNRYETLSCR